MQLFTAITNDTWFCLSQMQCKNVRLSPKTATFVFPLYFILTLPFSHPQKHTRSLGAFKMLSYHLWVHTNRTRDNLWSCFHTNQTNQTLTSNKFRSAPRIVEDYLFIYLFIASWTEGEGLNLCQSSQRNWRLGLSLYWTESSSKHKSSSGKRYSIKMKKLWRHVKARETRFYI